MQKRASVIAWVAAQLDLKVDNKHLKPKTCPLHVPQSSFFKIRQLCFYSPSEITDFQRENYHPDI